MSEFKVIETQEQLEEVLKDRLKRERETASGNVNIAGVKLPKNALKT